MEITVTNLFKEYDSTLVFDNVTFSISAGEKIGLVGHNGSGKSTLLKILAGKEQEDAGSIHIPKGMTIGYVPQDTFITLPETIQEYIDRVVKTARGSSYHIEEYKIETILDGFGIRNINLDTKLKELSSGQKTKVFLAAVLLIEPDVLLLDEPTNNLDLTALIWLENFIKATGSACVIISHDRKFLDSIVTTIFEINRDSKDLTITHGKYSEYLDRVKKERARHAQEHQEYKDKLRKAQNLVRKTVEHAQSGNTFIPKDNDKQSRGFFRDRTKGAGKLIQAYKKRIEHMEDIEKPILRHGLTIDIATEKRGGAKDIELENVVAGYKGGFKTKELTLHINFGERVVLLGDNGVGKSTLLKTILGDLAPLSGTVSIGTAVKIANFTQEHESLPREKTLFEFLDEHVDAEDYEIYNAVQKYGFNQNELKKKLKLFSPGGHARILFALFSLQSVNVLFLDEPTNHLDMEATEALEEVIKNYTGTIILVSHDRHLLTVIDPTHLLLLSADGSLTKEADLQEYTELAQERAKKLGYII